MRCYTTSVDLLAGLFTLLADTHRIISPTRGDDGVVRLKDIRDPASIRAGAQPFLSLKRFLFPHRERLWQLPGDHESPQDPERPLAFLGVPPCDAHALTFLDRVYGDDPSYQRRRQNLILVAATCSPQETCRCLVPDNFACDLFIGGESLYVTSERGAELAAQLPHLQPVTEPLPASNLLPPRMQLPADIAQRFAALDDDPLWLKPSLTCLACGACSAVCPTCYCYDLRDQATPDGSSSRERRWDNCLFSDFALVAGGHDFRPGLGARLKFRMRHKLLGFGELTGVVSCVGCGRCAQRCPADIGPGELIERLKQEP
mgnify:CR=1 FL=1